MEALYVKGDQSPLCQALCACLERMGQSLTEDPRCGEGTLWFPRVGQELTSSLLPFLEEKKEGSVLVMIPYFLWEGDPLRAEEAEWAGGVCAAVRALARRFAPHWRINCLRYGWMEGEDVSPRALEQVALGRVARIEELAHAALFFAGEGSSFMTGRSIDVNGGRVS